MFKKCIVLVSDRNYINKTFETIYQIRSIGRYSGDIVLLPHPELQNSLEVLQIENTFKVICKYFDLIDTSLIFEKYNQKPFNNANYGMINKLFQYHKFYIFDEYFKNWDYVLYIDVGMKIYKDINIFWEIVKENTLLAHCDSYPSFETDMRVNFNQTSYPEIYNKLNDNINLKRTGFQSTMMLFDTKIIKSDTFKTLTDLMKDYYISVNNDQGILNIYFNGVNHLWSPITTFKNGTFLYDFHERWNFNSTNYTMLKYPKNL